MKKGQNRAFGENSCFSHTWGKSWHRLIDLEFDYFGSALFFVCGSRGLLESSEEDGRQGQSTNHRSQL